MSTAPTLEIGINHHRLGQLREAELIYRQILQSDPRHFDALHLLGVIAHQVGKQELAIEYISRAISLRGDQPSFHSNLGEAYRAHGKLTEAVACFQQALRFGPGFFEAHNNLGNALRELGRTSEAIAAYEQALRLQPAYAAPHVNLGITAQDRGDLPAALDHCRQALAIDPQCAAAHKSLGNALRAQGKLSEAVESYQQSLRWAPQDSETYLNLGIVLGQQGQYSTAERAYAEALRLKPGYPQALAGLGILLQHQRRFDEALDFYRRALELVPNFADVHFHRAKLYKSKLMGPEALAAYYEVLRIQPNYPNAYAELALLLNELNQPDRVVEICRQGLELNPASGELYCNLGMALHSQGRNHEATECYRKSAELRPDRSALHSNYLYVLNFDPAYDPPTIFAEHLAWARRHAEPLTVLARPHTNDRDPHRRLRIGYTGPFFCSHAVNYFTEPLLLAHDHEQFEIFCYSDVEFEDHATARLKSAADHWRDVRVKTDDQLADIVREDRIDVLVDFSGHIGANRLLTFARKPAPVQVTYIGYQNTTGMTAMDYRLTDDRANPPGLTDPYYTEQLVRLPRSFFCYRPYGDAPPVTPLPALSAGHVTFGSFNNLSKVTPQVIDTWLQILLRVPKSRLLVLSYRGGDLQRRLHAMGQELGIEPGRIELFDKRPVRPYLQLIQQADIALDPFPFNGHTTTCDSLWMGVPVIMLEGNTYASRFGGSVLANLGLEHWIARTPDEYIELAIEMASDLDRLARLRGELRSRMANSVLLDAEGFTRNVEAAYRRMWHAWCAQSAAD